MPAYRGINANYETYDEKRAMTEKKRFNAWEHYRKVRTDLYGAGWEDVDEAANHEHIEALEVRWMPR